MATYEEVKQGFSMPLNEAMETQRAVRRLKQDPIDDETLLSILRLATKAPTGGNAQGWLWLRMSRRAVKEGATISPPPLQSQREPE